MDVDLDTFRQEFLDLKAQFETFVHLTGPLVAQMQNHAAVSAMVPSDVSQAAAQVVARGHVHHGLLDLAGKLIGLDRVTVAGGHGFDEDNQSYERRLRAGLGMADLPDEPKEAYVEGPIQGEVKTPASLEELDEILNKPDDANTKVNDDGTVSPADGDQGGGERDERAPDESQPPADQPPQEDQSAPPQSGVNPNAPPVGPGDETG
jgi:hypothetical protein